MTAGKVWQSGAMRVVESAVNRLLALDSDTPERLRPLTGRTLQVELRDLGARVLVSFSPGGLRLAAPADDEEPAADAGIETTLGGLAGLAASGGRRSRDVAFRGDVGVIQEVKQLFGELDVDWEEQLARITGDLVAHRVGNAVRGGGEWVRHTGDTMLRNLGEYLTEERRELPAPAEVSGFVAGVDRLREDVDRLEARLRRLSRRLDDGEGS